MINLANLKQFVKDNERDIVLVIGIVLIALLSFGAGRLTAPKLVREPIVIDKSKIDMPTAAISANLSADLIKSETSIKISGQNNQQGKFVASKNSKYYHWPWAPAAQRIKPENRRWFNSEDEAQKAGYKRASNFLELAPAGYAQ